MSEFSVSGEPTFVDRTIGMSYLAGQFRKREIVSAWHFDIGDPLAISIRFWEKDTEEKAVELMMGRDLLHTGLDLRKKSGNGDVRLYAPRLGPEDEHSLNMYLQLPSGKYFIKAPYSQVLDFYNATLEIIPLGEESATVEVAIGAEVMKWLRPFSSDNELSE